MQTSKGMRGIRSYGFCSDHLPIGLLRIVVRYMPWIVDNSGSQNFTNANGSIIGGQPLDLQECTEVWPDETP